MKVEINLDDEVSPQLRVLLRNKVPTARKQMETRIAGDVLSQTADSNPVQTGRSRAGWLAAAGSIGSNLDDGAILPTGEGEGSATLSEDEQVTSIRATNEVPYIAYLEYGTSRMAPFAMLRQSLARVISRIQQYFQLSR